MSAQPRDLDPVWYERAACRGYPTSLFFYETGGRGASSAEKARERQALAICGRCPVRRECLTSALKIEQRDAVRLEEAPRFWQETWERIAHNKYAKVPGKGKLVSRERVTVATTPAFGIWGGTTPLERHAKALRGLSLQEKVDILIGGLE